MRNYIVGGFVRNTLLGIHPNDTDYVVVGSNTDEMLAAGFKQVGADFPVFLHPETKDEYALARSEKSTGPGYRDFDVITNEVTLEADLMRRDLSINSMAMDDGMNIIDPFNGQEDLEKRVLRHTSDAFKDDPLRVLRLARFRATLPGTWTIAHETKVICCKMRFELQFLTPERIWKEVEKVIATNGLATFMETLYELNVLDAVFPWAEKMILCREGSKHHREANVFVHTMMMLRTGTFSKRVQLAILFHDIAKPTTYIQHGCSAGHDDEGLVDFLLPKWIPTKTRKQVLFLIKNHTRIYKTSSMKASKVASLLSEYKDPAVLLRQLTLAHADDQGRICDPGISKGIQDAEIIEAHREILEYSPAKWIESLDSKPSAEAIKQNIHRTNISIVKRVFGKD